MPSSWLTLIPPVMVIASALILHKIHVALSLGLVSALLVATHGHLLDAALLGLSSVYALVSNINTICLYGFLVCLGILVSLFNTTGSASAFAYSITRRIRSAVGLECASIILSLCMFVDDYLSILAIGHMMSPIADHCKIARLKLAFLIHSFAGPIVILFPISSWAATIIMYLDQASVHPSITPQTRIIADPFGVYLGALPYVLYSFLVIVSVWLIIRHNISFGPMNSHEHDRPAHITTPHVPKHPSLWGLTLPLLVLIGSTIIGLIYTRSSALITQHPFLVMLIASVLAIITSITVTYRQRTFSYAMLGNIIYNGVAIMLTPIGTIFLAALLSQLLANNIATGHYLAALLHTTIPLFLLPLLFFVGSLFTTFATGSAWGTFAIIIPIAIPMLSSLTQSSAPAHPEAIPLLLPTLGAIFSGAVCGDHISPISDTSIMTAASTRVSAIEHCYTQLPYTIPAIIGCLVGFTCAGYCTLFAPTYALPLSLILAFSSCLISLVTLIFIDKKIRNWFFSRTRNIA